MASDELVKWDEIEKQIDEARDLKKIIQMHELIPALKVLAKQKDGSLKTQNRCSRYRIFLEQNAGEIYQGLPDEITGRPEKSLPDETTFTTKQKAEREVGKGRKTLAAWAKESAIPKETVFEYERQCNEEGKELTSAGLLHYVTSKKEPPPSPPMPSDIYRVIYADPPWKYTEQGLTGVSDSYHRDDSYGNIPKHYNPMAIRDLCEMEMPKTEENAVLFLWVTWPFLEKAFKVINAWGFRYKTGLVWDKVKHNFGYYVSVRSELLLICTKGSCRPDIPELIDNVQVIERTARHSEKPKEFREIINKLYPHGNRIELFGRKKIADWEVWGNEIQ